jgi:uncharacterized membrane protein HdeD (DUF308 family)
MFLFAGNWWAIALRGVCGILFGLVAIFWPGIAIAALVFLFGAYALADGILAIISAVRAGARNERWGALAVEGIVGIIVGVWAFAAPAVTVVALVALVAAWAMITGVLEIIAAVRLRRTIKGEWMLGLAGIVSVVFGIAVAMAPVSGAVLLALWIGAYTLIAGILQLVLAFKLRRWLQHTDSSRSERLAA